MCPQKGRATRCDTYSNVDEEALQEFVLLLNSIFDYSIYGRLFLVGVAIWSAVIKSSLPVDGISHFLLINAADGRRITFVDGIYCYTFITETEMKKIMMPLWFQLPPTRPSLSSNPYKVLKLLSRILKHRQDSQIHVNNTNYFPQNH